MSQQIQIQDVPDEVIQKDYTYNVAVMSESKEDNLCLIWSLMKVSLSATSPLHTHLQLRRVSLGFQDRNDEPES